MDRIENITPKQSARFWSRVDKTASCWLWQGKPEPYGFGQVNINGQVFKAHRVAYILTHGSIPDGVLLQHQCDNHLCVNPDHLLLIPRSSFQRSAASKSCKLSEYQVQSIRERYAAGGITQHELAREHEVARSTIAHIITGRTWK